MRKGISWRAIIIALALFILSVAVNDYATSYATVSAGNSVNDIVLSNIPVVDVDGSFVVGPIIFWAIIMLIIFRTPNKLPFVFDSIALLLVIRAGFVTLTHLGPYPGHLVIDHNFFGIFSTGGDLFFSGHTAAPFLMALVLWDHKFLRYFCILSSIFFGVIVLLAHVHYSIDVAAAFFITYSIYHIAIRTFKKDLALFNNVVQTPIKTHPISL